MDTYPQQLYTMRRAFEAICLGERPWTPLGNFMNAWWGYGKEQREELVKDPLPHDYPEQYHHWAAFCAASADWFATTYDVLRPEWVDDPTYVLPDPWYFEKPKSLWPRLRKETLPEFSRRNIFCGDRVYANKWEYPLGRMQSKYRDAWDLTVTPQQWHARMQQERERSWSTHPDACSQTDATQEQEQWWQEQEQRLQAIASQRRKHRVAPNHMHLGEEQVTPVSSSSQEG